MNSSPLPLSDYDFRFPEELIAAEPAEPRDSSRLMVVRRETGTWEHRVFRDLPGYLQAGDCVVINRTKVFRARLLGKKSTGGKVDMLVVRQVEGNLWAALSSGLKAGMALNFPGGNSAKVEGLSAEGEYLCRFDRADMPDYLREHGQAPLPPYILKKRNGHKVDDASRYQTVYARDTGSIAAPTAGLHFTDEVLGKLRAKGVRVAHVTLHVGRGTFRPITAEDAREHRMLAEWYRIEPEDLRTIQETKGRLLSVGTTSTRTLESWARTGKTEGETDLYICPGHEFKVARGLLTNFHLPQSTPLVLASAFLGREKLLAAYQEAFKEKYRLYSYGDAMLIL